MAYEFNSRSTYLAARAQWKADYLELSAQIRRAKNTLKEASRAASATPAINRDSPDAERKVYYAAYSAVHIARQAKATLRTAAREHLALLDKMKEAAAKQWEAEHLKRETVI